jgi:heme-degrading monooxygenase HmoA
LHALLFEVLPTPEGRARYFEIAARLRPLLEENPGLLFIDRYESLTRPGLILSHSLWRDEASLARWRSNETHYGAQCIGRRHRIDCPRVDQEQGVVPDLRLPWRLDRHRYVDESHAGVSLQGRHGPSLPSSPSNGCADRDARAACPTLAGNFVIFVPFVAEIRKIRNGCSREGSQNLRRYTVP